MDTRHVVLVSLVVTIILLTFFVAFAQKHRRDPQRLFSWSQKRALLRQCRYRCEHKNPLWRRCRRTTQLQADHVIPWSRGGRTALHNGQILCAFHNCRKFDRMPTPIYRWRLARRRRKY